MPLNVAQELSNIQDVSVLEEVQLMRRFIESAYQSLTTDEASGAKFKEFGMDANIRSTSLTFLFSFSFLVFIFLFFIFNYFKLEYETYVCITFRWSTNKLVYYLLE